MCAEPAYVSLTPEGIRFCPLCGARLKRRAVGPDKLGAVSGITLTSANVGNAVGVAMASLLFVSWLSSYGVSGTGVPPYTEWSRDPEIFVGAFQKSCLVLAVLAVTAVIASAMRGREDRSQGRQ